jgi:uncharacterized damage-inducible protein DinB
MSNDWLRGLYGHQEWADAEHWRAIGTHPAAREDDAVRTRLHHIHFVQRAFLWTVGDRQQQFVPTKAEDFATLDQLRSYAREYHEQMAPFLAGLSDARLAEQVSIVWFTDPPLTITVAEALTQCAMHSHYHRGQNATRLRELGGVPPTTDLIVWQWKGRPAGTW